MRVFRTIGFGINSELLKSPFCRSPSGIPFKPVGKNNVPFAFFETDNWRLAGYNARSHRLHLVCKCWLGTAPGSIRCPPRFPADLYCRKRSLIASPDSRKFVIPQLGPDLLKSAQPHLIGHRQPHNQLSPGFQFADFPARPLPPEALEICLHERVIIEFHQVSGSRPRAVPFFAMIACNTLR